ncbi:Na/Pi symporter [Paucibacter sp. APW11]|uniref:Na/Pi symporter n=1 Tax=Roseateles aquae TaxID=3077235 RepID=A0ABU3PC79_9BURK|nr:Na/Pi symporter [Paucibacter sp. APW11]MDT8999758.1 Na/Pi symporter [Paucibacter sp. APW11]
MSIFVSLFAGLGLFFIGVRLISNHLRQLMGPRLRQLIARAIAGRGSPALMGLAGGAVMQSVIGVIHVLVALVTAGAMERRQAFPIIRWANIGTAMLVLVAALNLHVLALCLVGLTGLAYYHQLDQSPRFRQAVGALLGLGLLFLGTDFIKAGAALMKTEPWLRDQIAMASTWLIPSFVLGALIAWLAQSSTTLAVITMSMAASGLLGYDSGAMMVLGAGLGSGLSAWSLAGRLQGSARQLVLFQVQLRAAGLLAMLLLYALNRWALGDPAGALMTQAGWSVSTRLVALYMAVQAVSDLASRLLQRPLERLLERWSPPTAQEDMSKPRFIHDEALDEPETALLLAEREQQALLAALPAYLDALRQLPPGQASAALLDAGKRQSAQAQVLRQCEQFLTELADRHRSRGVLERAMVLRDRNRLLASLQESLVELDLAAAEALDAPQVQQLLDQLVESLHMMLETLAEAAAQADPEDLSLLRALTHDRSELMDSIRRRLLGEAISASLQQAMFTATTVFERCTWLLRRYVLLLDTGPAAEASS